MTSEGRRLAEARCDNWLDEHHSNALHTESGKQAAFVHASQGT
jgi:hypothetical protein